MDRALLPGGASVLLTTAAQGNFADSDLARPCCFVHQIHGSRVMRAEARHLGELGDADALVSTSDEVVLAVRGADCPLIGLSSPEGVIAAVHAGWKGLLSGVIEQAVSAMQIFGATEIFGAVGPFIGPECYEFSVDDLVPFIEHFGKDAQATTSWETPALDLGFCIDVEFDRFGIERRATLGGCTACSTELYSWRARKDVDRHGLLITRNAAFTDRVVDGQPANGQQ